MKVLFRFLAVALVVGITTGSAAAKRIAIPVPPKPGVQASQAEVIVVGKVVEIEKDTVDVSPFKGAPKDQKVSYKVAVLKISEGLMGTTGITQLRIGFPADAAPATDRNNAPARGRFGPIALSLNDEGCFFLNKHHDGDFYVLPNLGGVLAKKDDTFTKSLDEVKAVVKALEGPVAALQAKDKGERLAAAQALFTHYRGRQMAGPAKEEALPAEVTKLLLAALAEMPWQSADATQPSRSQYWYFIQPEKFGFKQPEIKPQRPGDPAIDYNKVWDEATAKFLKDNADKIKISKMVGTK